MKIFNFKILIFNNKESKLSFRKFWHGYISNHKKGFIFLEILISIMLIDIVFTALLGIGFSSYNLSNFLQQNIKINALVREEMEVLRSYRDGTQWATNGLGAVVTATPYYFSLDTSVNPNQWKLNPGTESAAIFTRNVVFDKVSRDPATNIIESTYNASRDDSSTRKVTVTIGWNGKSYQTVTYLTNWQKK